MRATSSNAAEHFKLDRHCKFSMKKQTLLRGFLSGLLGLFGCGDGKPTNKTAQNVVTILQFLLPYCYPYLLKCRTALRYS